MSVRNRKSEINLLGAKRDAQIKVSAEIALELAIYAKAGHRQKDIVEEAVLEFIKQNPLPKKVRESCFVCVQHEYGVS